MKIIATELTEKESMRRDGNQFLQIEAESEQGEFSMSVYDGEPEDNTLSRNFSGIYDIMYLIQLAYESGKADGIAGIDNNFSIEHVFVDEI
ncbi:MAG: hypothetical protein ACRC5M_03005 [Anaeroplasmataceae bacterium]